MNDQSSNSMPTAASFGLTPSQTGPQATAPEFSGPADFAAQAHQALLGWGQTLSDAEQRLRFEQLAAVDDPTAFAKAAGQEMARHYMLLDALALRFAWHVTQARPEREDAGKAGKWLDLATKASREARRCLALAGELSQDTRAAAYANAGEKRDKRAVSQRNSRD